MRKDEASSETIRINAKDALDAPLIVPTSKGEIVSLVKRLLKEDKEKRKRLSNDSFRYCKTHSVSDKSTEEEIETYSGRVVLFHACRFVIAGSGFPCLEGELGEASSS